MPGNPPPPKKEVALALLERESVYVHLDPRAIGVVVPAWFKRQPQLVLHVGLNMPNPIPDLRVDDDSMSCTLSFNRSPFFCIVPWSSVYAIIGELDGHGMLWHDDVPPEVSLQMRAREDEAPAKKPSAERPLSVVPSPATPHRRTVGKAAAKPRAARDDGAAAKTRKSRAKKASVVTEVQPGDARGAKGGSRRGEQGMLIPIPERAKKPTKGTADPAAKPAPSPTPARASQPSRPPSAPPALQPAPQAATSSAPAPARAPALVPAVIPPGRSPPAQREPERPRPAAAGQPQAGKAQTGKPKREIPPYLRVVK